MLKLFLFTIALGVVAAKPKPSGIHTVASPVSYSYNYPKTYSAYLPSTYSAYTAPESTYSVYSAPLTSYASYSSPSYSVPSTYSYNVPSFSEYSTPYYYSSPKAYSSYSVGGTPVAYGSHAYPSLYWKRK